jgi:hypothetical protein
VDERELIQDSLRRSMGQACQDLARLDRLAAKIAQVIPAPPVEMKTSEDRSLIHNASDLPLNAL